MANPSAFATNSYQVTSRSLDYQQTGDSISYHGTQIVVQGNVVGRIQSWQPDGAYNRDGEHVYELNKNTMGLPIDYVPGKATGFTVSYARVEAWDQEFERALGYGEVFSTLIDQTRPFVVQEFLFKGQNPYRVYQYSGCWLKSKNPEAWTSDGNYIHKISGQLAYVSRIRVL
jgi:hypothetical protein